jgi:hypothetical protein
VLSVCSSPDGKGTVAVCAEGGGGGGGLAKPPLAFSAFGIGFEFFMILWLLCS